MQESNFKIKTQLKHFEIEKFMNARQSVEHEYEKQTWVDAICVRRCYWSNYGDALDKNISAIHISNVNFDDAFY